MFVASITCARANDSYLPAGGSPSKMTSHRSISMQREYVRLAIGKKLVTVDCEFTFRNTGRACQVRMGFPDQQGKGEPDTKATRKGFFRSFNSWVDGRWVRTKVVPSDEPGEVWHVKDMRFPARATLEVRDRYTVDVGRRVGEDSTVARVAQYVLHTGSSWRGAIGRTVVDVVFENRNATTPLHVKRIPDDGKVSATAVRRPDPRGVYYQGPCKPTVFGRRLRFVRTKWRPDVSDDIEVVFSLQSSQASSTTSPRPSSRMTAVCSIR
jgi:hypothetical protein